MINALGGVFFLDEAYALVKSGEKGFGVQALDELMHQMDLPHTPLMIFAGYEKNMEGFLQLNEGLRRRVKVLKLQPYSDGELTEIIKVMAFM